MITGDLVAVIIQELILFGLVILAIVRTIAIKIKSRRSNLQATVNRGPQSMSSIHAWFGITSVLFTLAIDVADALAGYKALVVLINYSLLLYLFFFNSWFRNQVLIPFANRTRRD